MAKTPPANRHKPPGSAARRRIAAAFHDQSEAVRASVADTPTRDLWKIADAQGVPRYDAECLAGMVLACEIGDAVARMVRDGEMVCCLEFMTPAEYAALKCLEAVTRSSALRKVRP